MSKRFIAFDHQGGPLFDLDVGRFDGEGAVRYERINGEHKLDIATTQRLVKGVRILSRDGTGRWREWVVDEPCETHDSYTMVGTYGCTWSMQYDLATVSGGELWPGTYEPIAAATALAMVLGVQDVWEVGTVTVTTLAGTSLYDGQVWDYLGKLQEVWGGEIEPRIVVDSNGVTHRYVDWLAHVGSEVPTRRFEYGEDCTGITRKVDPGPHYCRIVPRGGHDATDADGVSYSERVGIEEEPYASGDGWVHDAGSKWVRDPDAELDFRVPDGNGGWRYPEKVVIYDSDDPEELLELASADVHDYTRPKPTYKIDVTQYAEAGRDPHGVQLGDEVHVVDREFGEAPLRLQGRVVEWTVNELDETDMQLVIGSVTQGIESAFRSMMSKIDTVGSKVKSIEGIGTIVYLQALLDAINAEINATGGYTYLIDGEGTVTYDIEVDDPLVGYNSSTQTWASQVTQMKGGTLRFANTKKPSFAGIGDWNWTNVITADGYLALAATIARITTGFIGNATSGNYWNLDTGEFRIEHGQITLTIQGYRTNGIITMDLGTIADVPSVGNYGRQSSSGTYRGMRIYGTSENPDDALYILLDKDHSNSHRAAIVGSTGPLRLSSGVSTSTAYSDIVLYNNSIHAYAGESNTTAQYAINVSKDGVSLYRAASGIYQNPLTYTSNGSYLGGKISINGTVESTYADITRIDVDDIHADTVECSGGMGSTTATIRANNLYVSGTKSRLVNTNNYDERLLYCYESPSPLFGDVGSGAIGNDGTCMVSIDDVFSECARTDMAYQVFLQKCGQGDLWVSEKTPTHFVVGGTPGLPFDWEMKAHQIGYEADRLEDIDMHEASNRMGVMDSSVLDLYVLDANEDEITSLYESELNYVGEIESLY